MPRNGSGAYALPASYLAVTGETIQASQHNLPLEDLAVDANTVRPVAYGGTGAATAAAARTTLGLAIGTNVQAYDAGLQSIAGLTTAANQMIYTTAADAYATTALTPFARTILDDADAAAVRSTIGANDASNLTTGTVPNARISGAYDGITTLTVTNGGNSAIIGSGSYRYTGNSYGLHYNGSGSSPSVLVLSSNAATTSANGAWMALYGSSHDTQPGYTIITSGVGGNIDLRNGGATKVNITPTGMNIVAGAEITFGNSTSAGSTLNNLGGVPTTRTVSAGTGLTGGGDLSANRSFAVSYGTTAGTAAQGNDSRIVNAVQSNDSRIVNAVQNGTSITAGNGLTGGGTLAANRTIALGTPSSITNSTTNSVTSTSHTHALGFVAAEVYTGTGVGDTDFPVGHTINMFSPVLLARNAIASPCLNTAITDGYTNYGSSGAGAVLAGVWRVSGLCVGVNYDRYYQCRRIS